MENSTTRADVGMTALCLILWFGMSATAQVFRLPTANHALFEKGGEARFFAPTVGKPWTSGTFGCVRTDGWQMHEGLDILSVQKDRRGEPTDPVMASADGVVAYVNSKSGLSNYGRYVILHHVVEGLEVYTLYAHLSEIRSGLKAGAAVKAGETIATLGRSSNTRSGIGKDRAHVHFEINLLVSERFPEWFKRTHPGERNDHGLWNGRNMVGLDPRRILLDQRANGNGFTLHGFLRQQAELFRVQVRDPRLPWARRYAALVEPNPALGGQAPAGYELVFDYNGLPFRIIPKAASELKGSSKYRLVSVSAGEYERNHCRKLVTQKSGSWQLTPHGLSLLDQLTD
jgi:peptidoglycan LD-endopeptidase LytH